MVFGRKFFYKNFKLKETPFGIFVFIGVKLNMLYEILSYDKGDSLTIAGDS